MPALPSGNVTIVRTDLEGSTRLRKNEPERMADTHARHDRMDRARIAGDTGLPLRMRQCGKPEIDVALVWGQVDLCGSQGTRVAADSPNRIR